MSLSIPMIIQSGLNGSTHSVPPLVVTANEVGFAASQFGSQYILRMGLHFDRYVVSGYQPLWKANKDTYRTANPAASATGKSRATSVTGNIGESIAALVARRHFGSRLSDIEPIKAGTIRAPDFRIAFRPMVPTSFQSVVNSKLNIGFSLWPVESKAAATDGGAKRQFKTALLQLGAYWYMRSPWEPNVVGYGVIMCLIYRGSKSQPQRQIRVHLITPNDQTKLQAEIQKFRTKTTELKGFLSSLGKPTSPARSCLRDL